MKIVRAKHNNLPLWRVHIKNKLTGESIALIVAAATNREATSKASGLWGADEVYQWAGTEPHYIPEQPTE